MDVSEFGLILFRLCGVRWMDIGAWKFELSEFIFNMDVKWMYLNFLGCECPGACVDQPGSMVGSSFSDCGVCWMDMDVWKFELSVFEFIFNMDVKWIYVLSLS
uniref:Uncharacterized protein n=1 Tax=Setaria viridis TaxID=4556 RepID=A0A4U6TPK9_SETVI|nr:hypothetical protein SEVIR_7G013500v2 [Setaria viridis]